MELAEVVTMYRAGKRCCKCNLFQDGQL